MEDQKVMGITSRVFRHSPRSAIEHVEAGGVVVVTRLGVPAFVMAPINSFIYDDDDNEIFDGTTGEITVTLPAT